MKSHNKQHSYIKNLINLTTFTLILVCLDQMSKLYIIEFLSHQRQHSYIITSFLNLSLVYNDGISFGLFSGDSANSKLIFIAISAGISTLIASWIVLSKSQIQRKKYLFPLLLVMSGAIGNLLDRINIGAVIDFIDFHILNWHYPAFNLADSFIVIGAILFAIRSCSKKYK